MTAVRTRVLAAAAGAAAPFAFATGAYANSSTCDIIKVARPLCMGVESDGNGARISKAFVKNIPYYTGAYTRSVRFAAVRISDGAHRWHSSPFDVAVNATVAQCSRWLGGSLLAPPDPSKPYAAPCHTWPASGYRIKLEEWSGGAWRNSSSGDLDIKSK